MRKRILLGLLAALVVALGVFGATTRTATSATSKPMTGINDGRRVVLNLTINNTTDTILTGWFKEAGATDTYVVPPGYRLVLTGVSGSGGTVLGDYFSNGSIFYNGTSSSGFFDFVPTPATPSGISSAGGDFAYWTMSSALTVPIMAGESIGFTLNHANTNADATFTAHLTGYLVTSA
jgi:hypothetical protein